MHTLIAILFVLLIWGGNAAWRNWLTSQGEEKEIESRTKFSELEKEKMKIIIDAFKAG